MCRGGIGRRHSGHRKRAVKDRCGTMVLPTTTGPDIRLVRLSSGKVSVLSSSGSVVVVTDVYSRM